jgi:hypothetical protein
MKQFSLWLKVDEIYQLFQQAVNAMRAKNRQPSMHEARGDDPLSQLKAMNPAFNAIFGVNADWVGQAAISVARLNNFPTKSADFTDTLTDTISDVYQLFSQDGHPLKMKLDELKAKEISPEQKMQEMIFFFKGAISRRWPSHVEETLKNKRHIDYGQGTRTDLHDPSFDSYDDIVKRGSARSIAGASSDDAPAQTFEPKGLAGGKPTIQSDEEGRTMGDDGTTFIQGIKRELKNMMTDARSDKAARLQKAHDMVEDVIDLRMRGEGSLGELMAKFGIESETVMNKILNDIKDAGEAATNSMGLNLQGTVRRLRGRYKQ